MDPTAKWNILKVKGESFKKTLDTVAAEKRLNISINGSKILSIFCTPLMVRELAIGLVLTEGIVEGSICTDRISVLYGDDIAVDIPAEGKVRTDGATVTSGCVGGITYPKADALKTAGEGFFINAPALRELFRRFQKLSVLYTETGCVHSAAFSDGNDITCFAEDIGRHNAVDKALGCAVLEDIDLGNRAMLTSGRLSSEIVSKCARWGIPVVASRGAPTALALQIAEEKGITVVGFVRGERMNIYTHPDRVRDINIS
jgi:FdhD protein